MRGKGLAGRSKAEALAFIEETRFALEHVYGALKQRRAALHELSVEYQATGRNGSAAAHAVRRPRPVFSER
jgi:hypothetical protein